MTTEPFFIVPKSAHVAILASVEGTNVAYCIAAYDVLRKLANDAGCSDGPVTLTIGQIAGQTGCSYRKAADVLRVLQAIGVITIESQRIAGTKSHAPSVYGFPTLGTICRTLGTDRTSNRAQLSKERKEQKELGDSPASPSAASKGSAKPIGPKPAPIAVPRKRNQLLDAFAELDGSDLAQITGSAWSGIGKALAEIKAVCPGVTPDEIRRRAGNYRAHFREASISPHALAKHWARCDRSPNDRISEPVRLGANLS